MAFVGIFNFLTISKRKEITIDGEQILDLTTPIYDFERSRIRFNQPPILITKEFSGKPHLICKSVYGDPDYTDLLLAYNNISNPLSVKEGDVLYVPMLEDLIAAVRLPNISDNVSKTILNKKLQQKDKNRIKALSGKDEVSTPNMAKEGSKPFIATKGRIVLGTNISENKNDDLSNTQIITEKIRKAIKLKILNQST